MYLSYDVVDHDTDVTTHIDVDLGMLNKMDDVYDHFFELGRVHSKFDGYKNVEVKNVVITEN